LGAPRLKGPPNYKKNGCGITITWNAFNKITVLATIAIKAVLLSRPEVARTRPQVLGPWPRLGVTRPRDAGHKAKAKALSIIAKA